jgi:hypothetical protein
MGIRSGLAGVARNVGKAIQAEAPVVEQAAAKGAQRGMSAMSKAILKDSIPSAVLTTGFNLIAGVNPLTALAAGAIDLGMNYGGIQLAGKYSPGNLGKLSYTDPRTKELVEHNQFIPSRMQRGVQMVAPIASSLAIMPLIQAQEQQQPEQIDQTVSTDQQIMQRQYINNLQNQTVSPGTNFQMQGLESTLDPGARDFENALAMMANSGSRWY